MKICRLAKKVLRFKEVKKTCFRLHLLLHNDYFKGHMACCQSLLEVVNIVGYILEGKEKK